MRRIGIPPAVDEAISNFHGTAVFVKLLLTGASLTIMFSQGFAQAPVAAQDSPCVTQDSVWKDGFEVRRALCYSSVAVEVVASPMPGFAGAASPISYMVSIRNYSGSRIDSDPARWLLVWSDKKGKLYENASLNARRFLWADVSQIFGRSTMFSGQSMSGFVYFQGRAKSKDGRIVITFAAHQDFETKVAIPVSTVPLSLVR
jgi:hypothetical protein